MKAAINTLDMDLLCGWFGFMAGVIIQRSFTNARTAAYREAPDSLDVLSRSVHIMEAIAYPDFPN